MGRRLMVDFALENALILRQVPLCARACACVRARLSCACLMAHVAMWSVVHARLWCRHVACCALH